MSQPHPSQPVLIFDGDCEMCRGSIEWIRRRDSKGLIETLPYQDPSVPERFPEISRQAFEHEIQLVLGAGGRLGGAHAIEKVLRLLPGTRPMASVFRIPGVRWMAQRVYRIVARNRRRFGCGEHCGLPPAALSD